MTGSTWTSGKATLNPPDDKAPSPLKRMDGEPVFDELWQAQVLALADTLVTQGRFSAPEWSAALGQELKRAEASGEIDGPETYYRAALAALEDLLARYSDVSAHELEKRRDAWAQAYEATPHGQPVELAAADD